MDARVTSAFTRVFNALLPAIRIGADYSAMRRPSSADQ
jgi:hypothetical protein